MFRRHFKWDSIAPNTLFKYLKSLTNIFEQNIESLLQYLFAVVFDGDGCTAGSSHYIAVFATLPSKAEKKYDKVLLGISPKADKTSQSAEEHFEFLTFVLSVFRRSMHNVVALINDNANTNRAFSWLIGSVLVGCHSPRFNLAVKDVIKNNKKLLTKYMQLCTTFRILFLLLCCVEFCTRVQNY